MKMADARARTRFATISPDPRPDTVTAQGGILPRRRAFSILDRTSAPGASRPDTLAAQGGILPRRRAVSIPDRPSAQGAHSCNLKNETAFKDMCSAALAKCSSCETCWEGIELHRQAHNFYETQAALRTKHLCACFAYTSYHVGQQLVNFAEQVRRERRVVKGDGLVNRSLVAVKEVTEFALCCGLRQGCCSD